MVLFTNVFLPPHSVERRYRQMVTDALAGERLIGMVLLRPGWETDYDGRPAVYPIGCSGARIIVTLIYALKARGLKQGVATLCIGGGEATAIAIEVL